MLEEIPSLMIKDAEEFKKVYMSRKCSEAFDFYLKLNENSKKYILETKPYSLYLRTSQIQS
jgi:methionyl-tRNA synthetase